MDPQFFSPINNELYADAMASAHRLGATIKIHGSLSGFPDLEGVKIALFGVLENRLDENRPDKELDFCPIRKDFYSLFPGNWPFSIADLGDIQKGETVQDTYFAVQNTVAELIKEDIIPVILGGSQDLIYAQYRAYDHLDQMVNLVNIDSSFDLGNAEEPISNRSYIAKIIVDQPYNLFNYSNIGYQTYFNSQDEIDLMERLFFDAYRLGEVNADISIIEPVMRDANLVGIDFGSVSAGATGNYAYNSPNGFDGKEICALARYAGISDKVSSFGVYEATFGNNIPANNMLVAQTLWYFIEGVAFRKNEDTISGKNEFIRYQVAISEDEVLIFYKSPLSGRWWIEIPFNSGVNNKLRRHTLLPCTQRDYLDACNSLVPERWYKAKRKNEI